MSGDNREPAPPRPYATPLGFKAIVIIRDSKGAVASHLLEYAQRYELDNALQSVAQWGGYHEIIRL